MPGWKSLIVCTGPDCNFSSLIALAKALITDLVIISTFLAVASFAYAGIVLLSSGGNTSARTKAQGIFTNVLIGYLWILGAWVVVYTITSVLLKSGYSLLGAP